MKIILTITLLISTFLLHGQDTVYLNKYQHEVKNGDTAVSYKVASINPDNQEKAIVSTYYLSGQLKSQKQYFPYSERKVFGKIKEWYADGKKKTEIDTKNGQHEGLRLTFWNNGQKKREDLIQNGKLISGIVWDSLGKKVKYYEYSVMPEFPGGMSKLWRYLGKNLEYPKMAKRSGIQGRVIVEFSVEKDGSISNVTIYQSDNDLFNEEAIRIVKEMPKWSPGFVDGEVQITNYNLPIRFSIH